MKKYLLALCLLLGLSSIAIAKEGSIGFAADVEVSGFFSPELEKVSVSEVFPDTPAHKAGLKQGTQIKAIDGCAIPGCPASKAKKLMNKAPGEILTLLIQETEDSEETELTILVEEKKED